MNKQICIYIYAHIYLHIAIIHIYTYISCRAIYPSISIYFYIYMAMAGHQEKQILTKVSGFAVPGELLAIMGPSGDSWHRPSEISRDQNGYIMRISIEIISIDYIYIFIISIDDIDRLYLQTISIDVVRSYHDNIYRLQVCFFSNFRVHGYFFGGFFKVLDPQNGFRY